MQACARQPREFLKTVTVECSSAFAKAGTRSRRAVLSRVLGR
jgi:hypothetical protein